MDLKYKFNANEFAKLNGITPSALRKRRLSGKLEGQYIKKGSDYFYTPSLDTVQTTINSRLTIHDPRSEGEMLMLQIQIIIRYETDTNLNSQMIFDN